MLAGLQLYLFSGDHETHRATIWGVLRSQFNSEGNRRAVTVPLHLSSPFQHPRCGNSGRCRIAKRRTRLGWGMGLIHWLCLICLSHCSIVIIIIPPQRKLQCRPFIHNMKCPCLSTDQSGNVPAAKYRECILWYSYLNPACIKAWWRTAPAYTMVEVICTYLTSVVSHPAWYVLHGGSIAGVLVSPSCT